jgi:hypothetical protein
MTLLSGDSVPDRIQTIIDTLLSTGFVQVNTVKMKYPFRRAMISWLLISNDGEIFVWVSHKAMRPWAEFFSYYPDASAVITRYPLGGTVESPMLVSRFAAKSFENALTHHRQTLVTWEGIRGRPLQMRDFTDVQATEDHYYKYHQRQDIRYILRVTTLTLIFLLVFITLVLSNVFTILTRQPYEVIITVIEVTSAGILLSITGFVIVYLSLTRQQRAVDS